MSSSEHCNFPKLNSTEKNTHLGSMCKSQSISDICMQEVSILLLLRLQNLIFSSIDQLPSLDNKHKDQEMVLYFCKQKMIML